MPAAAALALALAARMARRRSMGSSTVLARLMRMIEAWVFMSVLPSARRLTGTAASSGAVGTQSRSRR